LVISAVLLASGASKRLGRPKQLLPWGNNFLINKIIEIIQNSNVDEIILVLGYEFSNMVEYIDKDVTIVNNNVWRLGKSTSIKKGLAAIQADANAVIFFTIDQPFLATSLINQLIDKANTTQASIISTHCNGINTVPMLFKRECFPQLNALEMEQGGKKIINCREYQVEYVNWEDKRILIDIDTEEDYNKALKLENKSFI